jgi:hypothetical protein
MMARSRSGLVAVSTQAVLKALWPFIVVQCAVTALVFAAPWTVHQLDSPAPDASEQVVPSAQDIDQLMRDMADQAPEQDDKKP